MMGRSRLFKVLVMILSVLLAVLVITVAVTYISHRVKSGREEARLKELGYCHLVNTGDHMINLAKFGRTDGKHKIVSIAGLGLGDISVSQRKMTSVLEEDNLVVFADRAGHGLSGDTDHEMTLEFIVEDYRTALHNDGIEGPYILMAHSLGGAYATYWESRYPDEVEAVILIDGTELYDTVCSYIPYKKPDLGDKWFALMTKLGFTRGKIREMFGLYPSGYSAEDQMLGDALTLRTLDSIAPVSESGLVADNAQGAYRSIVTNDIPKLYICATTEKHIDIVKAYMDKLGNARIVYLPGSHMIYEQKPDECGKIIDEFIDGLR